MTAITFFLKKRKQYQQNSSTAGFTLLEVITVVMMVGALAAMSGAGYLAWLNRMRASAAQDVVFNAIRDAQFTAKQRSAPWQASFKEATVNGQKVIQWAVHYANTSPTVWTTIEQAGMQVDTTNTNLTTNNNPSGAWKVVFNHQGQVRDTGEVGKLITISNVSGANKRCVFVSTLLGAVRTDQDDKCKK